MRFASCCASRPRSRAYLHVAVPVRVTPPVRGAGQHRRHHPPDPLLPQLVGQVVQVCHASQDQPLLSVQDIVRRDRTGAVPARLALEARLPAQRVDQPRLPRRPRPDQLQRSLREPLPRLLRMLRQQRPRLRLGEEVAQPQRLGPDVERAAAEHQRVLRGGVDAVVANVPHATQDHAVREASWALVVTGAELSQHRQQRVAHQRVDLVDQQSERSRVGLRPAGEHVDQRTVRTFGLQGSSTKTVRRIVTQRDARPAGQLAEQGAHRPGRVLARRLADLEVRVDALVVASRTAVQEVTQRQQRRRVEVDPLERRDAVVVVRTDRPLGVEEAHRLHSERNVSLVALAARVAIRCGQEPHSI